MTDESPSPFAGEYTEPVVRLLAFGDSRRKDIPNCVAALGLNQSHIPELIRMATDLDLHRAESGTSDVWAPIHAMRALGQLRAERAVEPLMGLLEDMERFEDDYYHPEFSHVVGEIGSVAIPMLQHYLADARRGKWSRGSVTGGLAKIGQQHPESRDRCVGVLAAQLELAGRNGPIVNALIICSMMDLKATEAADVIRQAYQFGLVDRMTVSWEHVSQELGIDEEPVDGESDDDGIDADDLTFVDDPADVRDVLVPPLETNRRAKERELARKRQRKLARKARAQNRKRK